VGRRWSAAKCPFAGKCAFHGVSIGANCWQVPKVTENGGNWPCGEGNSRQGPHGRVRSRPRAPVDTTIPSHSGYVTTLSVVSAIRWWLAFKLIYFDGHGIHTELVVLTIWVVAGTTLTLVASRVRVRSESVTESPQIDAFVREPAASRELQMGALPMP
jgi:hypothetical protein